MGDAIFCDPVDHTCRGCEADGECSGRGLGAACLQADGTCVQCDDATDCAGDGCDPRSNTCSPNAAGSVNQCNPCQSDLDCDAGSACVSVTFPVDGGAEVGTYCALGGCSGEPDPDVYCGFNVGRGNRCLTVPTRAGVDGDYCVPATTTCEGYLHHRLACVGAQGLASTRSIASPTTLLTLARQHGVGHNGGDG